MRRVILLRKGTRREHRKNPSILMPKKTEALPKRKHFKSRKQRRRALMESGMDGVRANFIATASKKRLRMEKERSQKKGLKRKKSKAW